VPFVVRQQFPHWLRLERADLVVTTHEPLPHGRSAPGPHSRSAAREFRFLVGARFIAGRISGPRYPIGLTCGSGPRRTAHRNRQRSHLRNRRGWRASVSDLTTAAALACSPRRAFENISEDEFLLHGPRPVATTHSRARANGERLMTANCWPAPLSLIP